MENASIQISLFLRKDYQPHLYDLSGISFFDFYLDIKRCYPSDTDDRDMTILINDSVFDIPYAFEEGLLALIDEDTGAVVLWPLSGKERPTQEERRFLTLPRKSTIPGKKNNLIRSIPLNILDELKAVVQPGRRYRIWLRDLDLNVKWWSYLHTPSPNSPLSYSEPRKLVANSKTNKLFHPVSSIRSPPPIAITFSLSSTTFTYVDPPPTIRVSITNLGFKTITVKSSGEQPYTSTNNVNPHDALIVCPKSFPSLKNFAITSSTGATIMDIPNCASAGPHGLGKSSFTTLESGVPFVMEARFWGQEWLKKKLRDDGGFEFRLSLKARGAWWFDGGVDELFNGREVLKWKHLWLDGCLPVVLESEDVVGFRFVG